MKAYQRYVTSPAEISFRSSDFDIVSTFGFPDLRSAFDEGGRISGFLPGTGSCPHEPHGWHRPIRFNASQLPANAP
jgi:hypothetical protein